MPLETYFKRLLMCRGFRIQAGDASFCYENLVICLVLNKRKKRANNKNRKGKPDPNIHALSCGPFGTWSTPWELPVGTQAFLLLLHGMHFLLLLRLTFAPAARSVINPCLWRWVLSSVLQKKQVRVPTIFDLCYWREQLVPPDGLCSSAVFLKVVVFYLSF